MQRRSYYIINGITFYRLLIAPVLVYFIFSDKIGLFKWLLPVSFFTDLIDGYLARRYKVFSIFGAKLDSIADDLTIAASMVGLFVLKPEFIKEESEILIFLFFLFSIQIILALFKYRKTTSYHTYLAKAAAILQGTFMILVFLLPEPLYILFYAAAFVTAIELLEEIIIIFLMPEWKTDVKGIYWVTKSKKENIKQQN